MKTVEAQQMLHLKEEAEEVESKKGSLFIIAETGVPLSMEESVCSSLQTDDKDSIDGDDDAIVYQVVNYVPIHALLTVFIMGFGIGVVEKLALVALCQLFWDKSDYWKMVLFRVCLNWPMSLLTAKLWLDSPTTATPYRASPTAVVVLSLMLAFYCGLTLGNMAISSILPPGDWDVGIAL
mmetsp:Transcript_24292/g.41269  ORF Transcript_24292/g.41269 Transcript_24292/m.41269 type:complete len:180 (-) Transcript_24292:94-633(-)|eukprot:CAMPEP_0116562418 /NCGR_PEP_ID=MMETSP0397-20121206/12142_1 /TAXON_ID=216820 /ORGANISM="Cyclophora tenuis, Strain ECT3854" /LENGTH=179 /DNA_ID=CAMNT_0004088699 /DNA_START=35 /DNA_END=574 /DNA_ORIENTATION=+